MAGGKSSTSSMPQPAFKELDLACYPVDFRKKLHAFCWNSKGDVSRDDLGQDLWLYRAEITKQEGREFDPNDPEDQKALLRKLNRAYMKTADRKQRWAKRIDQEVETENGAYRWVDNITAPESSDPCVAFLQAEKAAESLSAFRSSYSEAAAYAITFFNFDNERKRLSAYLAIAACTLMKRVSGAIHCVKQQPSLFDRIDQIPQNFMPREGRTLLTIKRKPLAFEQRTFEFLD